MPAPIHPLAEEIVQRLDFDGAIYSLTQVAVKQRDEADKGTNLADKKYKQKLVEILSACQTALEALND